MAIVVMTSLYLEERAVLRYGWVGDGQAEQGPNLQNILRLS